MIAPSDPQVARFCLTQLHKSFFIPQIRPRSLQHACFLTINSPTQQVGSDPADNTCKAMAAVVEAAAPAAINGNASEQKPQPSEAELLQGKLFGYLTGALTSSLVGLGDTLGLYAKMKQLGKSSSDDIAEACGLSERFVREWLHQQVSRCCDCVLAAPLMQWQCQRKLLAVQEQRWFPISYVAGLSGLDHIIVALIAGNSGGNSASPH